MNKVATLILGLALALTLPSVAAEPALTLSGRWTNGPSYASAVSGSFAYFGSGGRIRALKIKEGG